MDKAGPLVRGDRTGTGVDCDVFGSAFSRKTNQFLNEQPSDSGVAKFRCDEYGLYIC